MLGSTSPRFAKPKINKMSTVYFYQNHKITIKKCQDGTGDYTYRVYSPAHTLLDADRARSFADATQKAERTINPYSLPLPTGKLCHSKPC